MRGIVDLRCAKAFTEQVLFTRALGSSEGIAESYDAAWCFLRDVAQQGVPFAWHERGHLLFPRGGARQAFCEVQRLRGFISEQLRDELISETVTPNKRMLCGMRARISHGNLDREVRSATGCERAGQGVG
jgi:hypothetical protein